MSIFIIMVLTCSASICSIYLALDEDMILHWWTEFIDKHIKSEFWRKPLGACITCMASTYGSVLWVTLGLIIGYEHTFDLWLFAVLCISYTSTWMYGFLE